MSNDKKKQDDLFDADLFAEPADDSVLEIDALEPTEATLELGEDDLMEASAMDLPADDDPFAEFAAPASPPASSGPASVEVAAFEMSGLEEPGAFDPVDEHHVEEVDAVAPPSPSANLFDEFESIAPDDASEVEAFDAEELPPGVRDVESEEDGAGRGRKVRIAALAILLVVALGGGAYYYLVAGSAPKAAPPVARQLPAPSSLAQTQPADMPGLEGDADPQALAAADGDERPTATAEAPDVTPPAPIAAKVDPAPAPEKAVKPEPAAAPAPTPKPAAKPAVAARPKAQGPAASILDVRTADDGSLVIVGDGNFETVKYFGMRQPNRIVVDVYGVKKGYAGYNRSGTGAIAQVRSGIHPGKVRLVIDLAEANGPLPKYTVDRAGDRIVVRP